MGKNKKTILVVILIAIVIGAAIFFIQQGKEGNSKKIKVSGNTEATDVRLSFRIAGKMKELLTDEGQKIKKSDVVARIETDELLQIKNQAEASLKAAESQYELDKAEYTRAENLFQANSISAQKRDFAKTKVDTDKANIEALKATFDLTVTRLGFAELSSPIDGFVLVKSAELGEFVQAGSTIFTVADLGDIWLTAYINEKDLGRVKLNQAVDIKTDTFPDKVYKGRISFISQEAEFTPKQIQTTEERVKLVYRIKIKIENPNFELKPGMPADGYIIE